MMPSKIVFGDLKRQHDGLQGAIEAAAMDVFQSGWYILGTQVSAFEEEFARYCGSAHGVSVASGTDAIHLALAACGIGEGDEVITVPNSAVPTVSAIRETGATPVFVDIDPKTLLLDLSRVTDRITARTRAIVPVHLYGHPVAMNALTALAQEHQLDIIEDCAQAHGALWQGQKVGSMGRAGCFSFYPSKNLGAYGDGGMVVTDDAALAERLRRLRFYGFEERDNCLEEGFNSRLDEMQAAFLRVKLPHLDGWNARRRAIAARYTALLRDCDLILPVEDEAAHHVYHLYVIRSERRDALRAHLEAHGIMTGIHYPTPIHLQEGYRFLGYERGMLPVSERAAQEILSLPMYPELTDDEVTAVGTCIATFFQEAPCG